ncbi:cysteine dioxygenase [Alcaligenaceae bacterium]|nr:cysteine dioxygenase [Alcaligenaceae bacterium]
MEKSDIEDDLEKTLARVAQLTTARNPRYEVLAEIELCLVAFVARHRMVFSFENFPLPIGEGNVLASYELNDSGEHRPALLVNAIAGGVSSVVHDHGTWAVIAGIEGAEHHRIYRRLGDTPLDAHTAKFDLVREVTVSDGRSLIIEEGLFHSIHTDPDQPALQLHLYGRSLDTISGRQFLDIGTGRQG